MMQYTKNCEKRAFETNLYGYSNDCGVFYYIIFCYPCAIGQAWAKVRGDKCECTNVEA